MNKLARVAAILCMACLLSGSLSAQSWQWLKAEGSTKPYIGKKIAMDGSGNIFVAMTFQGSITLGGNVYNASNSSDIDVILVKYDPIGALIWARQFSSTAADDVTSLVSDQGDGVYMTGNFIGPAFNYGSGSLTNSAGGFSEVYLLHLDGSGNTKWTFQPKGSSVDYAGKVFTAGKTVVLSGSTLSSTINFGSISRSHAYFNPVFLCTLDTATGTVQNAKVYGNNRYDRSGGVAMDKAGNIYLGGSIGSNSINFDGHTVTRTCPNGQYDIFLAKFDPSLNCLSAWSAVSTSTGSDELTGLTVDGSDNFYFTGYFNGPSLSLGGLTVNDPLPSEQFLYGSFDATGANTGTLRWLSKAGNDVNSEGTDIFSNGSDLYLAGYFKGASFNLATSLTGSGGFDGFLLKFDASGTMLFSDVLGGTGDDHAYGVSANSCGPVVTGDFASSNIFAGALSASNTLPGSQAAFTARYSGSLPYTIPVRNYSSCGASVPIDAGPGYYAYRWVDGETTQVINATASGTYFVTVTSKDGCQGKDFAMVNVVNADIIEKDMTICSGKDTVLHADTTYKLGVQVKNASHIMNVNWLDSIPTVVSGRYRLVVSGNWQPTNLGLNTLDAAYMYNISANTAVRKWQSPGDSPMPFLVDGNPLRPVVDAYRTDHTYEYTFTAGASGWTKISLQSATPASNSGTLTYTLYLVNNPVNFTWQVAGATVGTADSLIIKPTANTTYQLIADDGMKQCPASMTVSINPLNTLTLTSAAATESQSKCVNTPIDDITYTTTGATGVSVTGLPAGVTSNWDPVTNILKISGTPTAGGNATYTINLTGGCGNLTKQGTINVALANGISLSSAAGTDNQNICIGTALTPITYATTIATGIGTATGLPAGVTAAWAANTLTISGTPTASGTFNYDIPLTGGCGSVSAKGTIIVNANNTVSAASSTPTICINSALTNITHATTGATGIGAPTGLPAGVTAAWAANTITISGTPTASGTFNYTIPLTGGCGTVNATGTITVTPANTVTAASSTPILCINTALPNITHATTGATGIGAATGLPAGVTAAWAANTITISGTPTASGTFNYTIPLTGGCAAVNATGTITVTSANTAGAASATPTICINTALTSITHATTGATGIGPATGLPAGVTASWAANTITVSGTPTASGTFNYSIPLTGGCGSVNATGTIIVNANTAGAASSTPTLCLNTPLPAITHVTTGATGIGVPTGLPAGVTAAWAANSITISGTPTASGTFNYSIPLTGGCGSVNATGTITVTLPNTAGAASSTPTLCINTPLTAITHATTGATGIGAATGLPAGVTAAWAANTITISGTPTAAGTFNYTIPLTGGCGSVNATGTIIVSATNTVGAASSAPTLCVNTALTDITHATTGATGIGTATGLPAGVTANWAANTITISGTPTASGTFTYSIPLTGGCGAMNATGTITVTAATSITAQSTAAQTQCVGGNFTGISVTATGAGLSYQWYSNSTSSNTGGTAIAGATNASFTPSAATAGSTYYYCVVSGTCGSSQISAVSGLFLVNPGAAITAQSTAGQTQCAGGTFSAISVTATGAGLTYQWYSNSSASNMGGTAIAGATNASFTPLATTAGSTYYYCVVSTSCGPNQTSAVSGIFLVTPTATITAQSTAAQTQCVGGNFSAISVTATGAGLTYQWYSNSSASNTGGTAIAGATNASFTPSAATAGSTYYYCVVSASCGPDQTSAVSGLFLVNPILSAAVSIATPLTTLCAGAPASFTATPTNGGSAPTYQWQVNGANVGTNSASFASNTLANGDNVTVIMTSNAQCAVNSPATSNGISMLVNPLPTVTASTPAANCGPGTMTLNATPSAGNINWYATATGGTSLATATAFPTPLISTTTTYYAEATSLGCASATRTPVVATVNALPTPSITRTAGTDICVNGNVNLTTQSGMSAYTWTVMGVAGTDYNITAGGLGATDNSVSLTWLTPGSKSVQVNYTDANGCTATAPATNPVNVNPLPTGALSAPADLTFCKGDGLSLNASGGTTYAWYRNGVIDPLNTGATINAKDEGTYTVEVISAAGCKAMASGSAILTQKAQPIPAFTVTPACAGSATDFVNSSTYAGTGNLSFNWNLDDGFSANTTDASQIYTKGGNKRITMTAVSSTCPNSPETAVALVAITSSRPAVKLGPVDAMAGQPVTLQARTFGQVYAWSPATGLSDPSSARPDATLSKDANYTVTITDIGGCVTVDTVHVRVFPGQRIYVPTAFTPNGDGLNDRLHPIMVGFKELTFFRIYNRYGNLVHETNISDAAHGWDGRFKGYNQPSGTYVWALRATDDNGKVVDKTGTFTIIR